ncbi:MAG: hypothetical protein J0L80_15845 [Chitinophagales bacterium]|nr:hypothetical protein [Chitinophagales bacterium]
MFFNPFKKFNNNRLLLAAEAIAAIQQAKKILCSMYNANKAAFGIDETKTVIGCDVETKKVDNYICDEITGKVTVVKNWTDYSIKLKVE